MKRSSPESPAGARAGVSAPASDTAASRTDGLEAALCRAAAQAEPEDPGGDRELTRRLEATPATDEIHDRLDLAALGRLADRLTRRARVDAEDRAARQAAWALLDVLRRPALLSRLAPAEREAWAQRLLGLIEASHFTVGPLFRQRARRYGSKVFLEHNVGGRRRTINWRRFAARVEAVSRGLLSLDHAAPVAILSENRIEMVLADLACLTSGLVNVLVPANATESDVAYILRHSGARTLIVSNAEQLRKIPKSREAGHALERVYAMDPVARRADVEPFAALLTRGEKIPRSEIEARADRVRIDDLATVMYTSGTTGTPKGIRFSQRNVVFKRFARALALPRLGEDDVFLCFLPLFHTFGRFFELLGCVFWGARYCLLDDTSPDGLAAGMQRHRPTVFISVPKKWIQLYEQIGSHADPLEASDAEILAATRRITGGRLAWGLSAAGHLDSEIFRFFQRQGVELSSGFGMTEATGGITMTPPGEYRDGSLGVALPGIELRLADDGELLVRGAYVTIGYLDPPEGGSGLDPDGWLPTGDLMEQDADGHFRLVDRKKEIYKNVKGETIAPQRVENHFRDFESVQRAFLVGDHREFNTLLIYPNPNYAGLDLSALPEADLREHFRSLVISVNTFLAPYERIVDFALIDRDLDVAHGELTAKGTPRRKIVEQHFAEAIQRLYRRTSLTCGGAEIVLPNWLFQTLGLTARDVRCGEDGIALSGTGNHMRVKAHGATRTQIGSHLYTHRKGPLNLGSILTTPALWLGNEELVRFVPLDAATRQRPGRSAPRIRWAGRVDPFRPDADDRASLASFLERTDLDVMDLDLVARMLASSDETDALAAVGVLARALEQEESSLIEPARLLLGRLAEQPPGAVRRRAFQVLAPAEREARFGTLAARFLEGDPDLFDASTGDALCDAGLSEAKLDTLMTLAHDLAANDGAPVRAVSGLSSFLATYGSHHPVSYRRIRACLERIGLFALHEAARDQAAAAAMTLRAGFREWLGQADRIAVDFETRREYRWEDVTAFDDAVPAADRRRLLSAIKLTPFLREAVFLFYGVSVRLSDIGPRGVRVRLAGSRHGKSVYRLTVQTRFQGSFDLAANLNHDLSAAGVREEIQWLILSGDPGDHGPLVEEFGGYWPEQDLWSEEYIPGETLNQAMRRLAAQPDGQRRLGEIWPFMAWAALSAYVDFWRRSGKRLELAAPDMTNVVVPTDDFVGGVRLVSLSRRRPHRGLLSMLRRFRDEFVRPAEEPYPALAGLVDWPIVFSSLLEIVGEAPGLELLREAAAAAGQDDDAALGPALASYLGEIERDGFMPLRLFFAVERYRRWISLSRDATPQARALTVQELFETYGLQRLAPSYPAIRVRFFLETALADCPEKLARGLHRIIRSVRHGELAPDELVHAIDGLRADQALDEESEYFLARLSYPYLRPEDSAGFVTSDLGGRRKSEIVVSLEDHDGQTFRIRHALSPKEVERLYQLFLAAKLDVRFQMEHQYLVAINDRSHIVGGIYYEVAEDGGSAHLEKIVVAERYRHNGVAHGLMNEFFNRLRTAGLSRVTTGFFRPEYFYRYGFRVEKRYAGLVKTLSEPELPA